jgi:drug/metabolite transporter (DMT)-like permease
MRVDIFSRSHRRDAGFRLPWAAFLFAALLLLPFCRGFRVERRHWRQMTISGLWFALNLCLWIYSVSTTASLGEGRLS